MGRSAPRAGRTHEITVRCPAWRPTGSDALRREERRDACPDAPAERAWIGGGSPTTGFLKGTGENALGGFFSGLAG
ncbi:hypothetical protein ACFFRU_37340, partial [Planobispora longispora]